MKEKLVKLFKYLTGKRCIHGEGYGLRLGPVLGCTDCWHFCLHPGWEKAIKTPEGKLDWQYGYEQFRILEWHGPKEGLKFLSKTWTKSPIFSPPRPVFPHNWGVARRFFFSLEGIKKEMSETEMVIHDNDGPILKFSYDQNQLTSVYSMRTGEWKPIRRLL